MVFKKGHIAWNKGIPHSEETRQKISDALQGRSVWNKGIPRSAETKRKLSEAHMGLVSPNKGKHLSDETKKKISIANTGKRHSEDSKRKMSKAQKGRIHKPFSEETKRKIGEASKKRLRNPKNHPLYGKHHSEETKAKMRQARLKQVLSTKDTSIEIAMQNELNRRGIVFKKHFPVCGICQPDIVFPERKIAIFCDGDYWHNLPEYVERDKRQNRILRENDWTVHRFWEHEIKTNVHNCVNKIMQETHK